MVDFAAKVLSFCPIRLGLRTIMTLHVGNAFDRVVERLPDRTAVVDPENDTRYTYEEWGDQICGVAASLADAGIEVGDCVGAVTHNRVELGTLFWASQYLGAAFVPYNVRASPNELRFLVNNTTPEILLFSEATADTVTEVHDDFDDTDWLVAVDEDSPSYADRYNSLVNGGGFEPRDFDAEQTSVILHTSGTTGRPKGVPRSHEATYTSSHSHAIQVRWEGGESTLGLMPVFHTMGLHTLTTVALLNGKWIPKRSFSPEHILDLIESEGITSLYLVPTVFHDLLDVADDYDTDLSSVQRLAYAGTPMTATVQREVYDLFDPEEFVNHYGSTEVFTYATCAYIDEKPGCVGQFGMNPRVRVVTPEEGETVSPTDTVEQGETGEIIVDASSPEAFDGYLDRPEADEKSFEDGWYFTGDLGYRDEDGDLFVVGRVDDMIISGGENIYPVEVEDLLVEFDAVDELAIVGVEDDQWNEVVTAYLPVDDTDEEFTVLAERLDTYCRESNELADFKRPRNYVFVDELAKSNVGKVLRGSLAGREADIDVYEEIRV
jgi:2-furoate---CoA ligase